MTKATVIVNGVSFYVEYDHSDADHSVGWGECVDLCSVKQSGAGEGECILDFLSDECVKQIEEALFEQWASDAEEAKADRAESRHYDRMEA